MLYDIALSIRQHYDAPAAASRQTLRLLPPTLAGEQHVVAAAVDISPGPAERRDRRDFFGNMATDLAFGGAHEEVVYSLAARVRREAGRASLPESPPVAALAEEIAAIRSLAPDAPHHFLAASPRLPEEPAFAEYARASVPSGVGAAEAVEAVGLALHRDMAFDAKATEVDTPALEAFRRRRGVCQDFTHAMIACLRALGVPAGYVSGFLRTVPPPGRPRLQGADAMHAWVRAWCGRDACWVEYDPTNACLAGDGHVAVARGRDYSDVAPVKGVLRSTGSQTSRHEVTMTPVGERDGMDEPGRGR